MPQNNERRRANLAYPLKCLKISAVGYLAHDTVQNDIAIFWIIMHDILSAIVGIILCCISEVTVAIAVTSEILTGLNNMPIRGDRPSAFFLSSRDCTDNHGDNDGCNGNREQYCKSTHITSPFLRCP